MEKKYLLAILGIAASLSFSACQDEEILEKTPLPQGAEIRFGAVLPDEQARTVYGAETTIDGKTVWPIYWKLGSATAGSSSYDHIFIYSPQGNAGRNQASYSVKPTEANQNSSAVVEKDGAYGVQVGDAETYDFYALYPASAATNQATGTTIRGSLPGAQTVTIDGTLPTAGVSGRAYTSTQDMDNCLMIGSTTGVTLSADQAVSIPFTPFSSVLDITINGPETNTTTGKTTARITSVIIEADAPISGDFSYDFSTNTGTYTGSNSIAVSTMGVDSDGDIVGVPLISGNTLNVKAFLLPNPAVTEISVRIVTSDSQYWKKSLVMTSKFEPRQIHKVSLPKINLEEDNFDYSVWLSQLDPRIYISELSLPGSVFSFSQNASNSINNTQTRSIAEQFDAGIRVFQTHVWIANQTSEVDGQNSSIVISVLGQTINRTTGSGYLTLVDVLKELNQQMETTHSDEFCVLILSDYANGSGDNRYVGTASNGYFSFAQFYSRLRAILDNSELNKYIATDFSPNTTIADIKGKVIVKYATNQNESTNASLNGARALFNEWFTGMSSNVYYSPLKWGTTSGLADTAQTSMPSSLGANDMLYINFEEANAVSVNNIRTTWASDTQVRSQISAFNTNYNSTNHNIFGMTFLGGNGASYSGILGSSVVTTTQVAQHYNNIWLTAVNAFTGSAAQKPYGWVLFNCVGTEATTTTCIEKVISQNNDNNFKLNRDRTQVQAQSAPSGDVSGVNAGGSIF